MIFDDDLLPSQITPLTIWKLISLCHETHNDLGINSTIILIYYFSSQPDKLDSHFVDLLIQQIKKNEEFQNAVITNLGILVVHQQVHQILIPLLNFLFHDF